MDTPSFSGLVSDLALLHENGIKIVLVPLRRRPIDELLATYGIETERVDGLRISTPEAMPLIEMAAFNTATRLDEPARPQRGRGRRRQLGPPAPTASGAESTSRPPAWSTRSTSS